MRLDERIAGLLRIRKNLIPSAGRTRWQNEIPRLPLRGTRCTSKGVFLPELILDRLMRSESVRHYDRPTPCALQETPRWAPPAPHRKRVRPFLAEAAVAAAEVAEVAGRARKESGRDGKQRGAGGGPITSRPSPARRRTENVSHSWHFQSTE